MKGRTARQGHKGSFSMVLLARELESEFTVSKEEVQQMVATDSIYDTLCKKRVELLYNTLPQFVENLASTSDKHAESQQFVTDLLGEDEAAVEAFLLRNNSCSTRVIIIKFYFVYY